MGRMLGGATIQGSMDYGLWAVQNAGLGYGLALYGIVWYGMVWHDIALYGMVWYGVVWCTFVWCGMVYGWKMHFF